VKVGVPKESAEGERRVALVPDTISKLEKSGFEEVVVESGAGRDYNLDEAYEEAGARVASDADEVYKADVILKIRKPDDEEIERMHEGQILVGFLEPLTEPETIRKLAERGVTAFSLELIPRIARAQSMDALSSMGSLGGYKAALIAADSLGRYLPMMTTAAGTTKAAKAMVLGVGVAGLQAIATMKRLGAEVEAFDIRPEVADQVRSLGATWIEAKDEEEDEEDGEEEEEEREPSAGEKLTGGMRALFGLPERSHEDEAAENGGAPAESESDDDADQGGDEEDDSGGYAKEQTEEKQKADQALVNERIAEMDVVLTTALVPGKKAPTLVTEDMVKSMKPGSVLVDLAAEAGGNCELSEAGEVVMHEQVEIHGPTDVASSMPIHSSQLLSRNMASLLDHLVEEVADDDGEASDGDGGEGEDEGTEGEGDKSEGKADDDGKRIKLELDFEDEITAEACVAHDGEIRQERVREALEGSKG
jgi:NAD(P) transhydrogenase subunit alpha